MAQTCNAPVKCWDNGTRPCIRPAGHKPGYHNPFSPEHPKDPIVEQDNGKPTVLNLLSVAFAAAGLNKKVA